MKQKEIKFKKKVAVINKMTLKERGGSFVNIILMQLAVTIESSSF